jgi:nucleoside-diphosphate-sugar epimerase
MKRAIITGATGVIGTALIDKLISEEVEVLVFCRKDSKRNNVIPNHPLVQKQYCSLNELATVENNTGKSFDVFYHFAWAGTTGSAREDMYLQNQNVIYSLDAVGAASRFGCKTFIGAGSQAEYGRAEGSLKATTPTFPETGYGIGKLCAGLMSAKRAKQLGMNHIWVRVLSIYGPNDGPQSMVMSTISKLKKGIVPEFTKGEQLWDYLYSEDAANAFYLLGKSDITQKIYVLGSGRVRPLVDYIKDIRDIVSPSSELMLGAIKYSPNQVMYLRADTDDLVKDIGFEAIVPFETGIKNILVNLS